jgi:hypothetical protein
MDLFVFRLLVAHTSGALLVYISSDIWHLGMRLADYVGVVDMKVGVTRTLRGLLSKAILESS